MFKIRATLGHRPRDPITVEKVYHMTVTNDIAEGYHGEKGKKIINGYCRIPVGVPTGNVYYDILMQLPVVNTSTAADECLELCLNHQGPYQKSIYCCEYNKHNDNNCRLMGSS